MRTLGNVESITPFEDVSLKRVSRTTTHAGVENHDMKGSSEGSADLKYLARLKNNHDERNPLRRQKGFVKNRRRERLARCKSRSEGVGSMRFPLQTGGPMEESSNKIITLCELSQMSTKVR